MEVTNFIVHSYVPDPPGNIGVNVGDLIISAPEQITDLGVASYTPEIPEGEIILNLGGFDSNNRLVEVISDAPSEVIIAAFYVPAVPVPGSVTLTAEDGINEEIGEEISCAVVGVKVLKERRPWVGTTVPTKYKGYVYDERISGIAGPFVGEDITAITNRSNTGELIAVNTKLETLRTDLLDFNAQNYTVPYDLEEAYPTINTPIKPEGEEDCVVCSRKGQGFSYRGQFFSEPFSDPLHGEGTILDPMFFRNSYMSVIETNWIHLGDEHNEKQVHRIDLSFHKNSFGALFGYVKNEEGVVKGQYKGEVKESMKVFTNLRGRRFKVKLFIVTHKLFPWALREMAIGHLYGKSF